MLQAGAVEDIDAVVGAVHLRRGRGINRQTCAARWTAICAYGLCCCCRCGRWRNVSARRKGVENWISQPVALIDLFFICQKLWGCEQRSQTANNNVRLKDESHSTANWPANRPKNLPWLTHHTHNKYCPPSNKTRSCSWKARLVNRSRLLWIFDVQLIWTASSKRAVYFCIPLQFSMLCRPYRC